MADTETRDTSLTLRQRLLAIQADLKPFGSESKNQFGKEAIGIEEVERQLGPLFVQYGVLTRFSYQEGEKPSVAAQEGKMTLWNVPLQVRMENVDNPEDFFIDYWVDQGTNPMAASSFTAKGYYKRLFHIVDSEEAEASEAGRPESSSNRSPLPHGEASPGQIRKIAAMLRSQGRDGDADHLNQRMTAKMAHETIDLLQSEPDATLPNEVYMANAVPPSTERAPSQDGNSGIPKASPFKPASANQLATMAKLSRLLGKPEDWTEDITSADASERITALSTEYNTRKGQARQA